MKFLKKFKKETYEERIKREEQERIQKEKDAKQTKLLVIGLIVVFVVGFPILYLIEKNEPNKTKGAISSSILSSSTVESSSTIETLSSSEADNNSLDEPLTIDNNSDLNYILNDHSDDYGAYKDFAEKYYGKTIAFDGYIANIQNYANYDTRFDFLIYYGNSDSTNLTGPGFKIENTDAVSGLKIIGNNIPDVISAETNIHIIANIAGFGEGGLIKLEPLETRIR